ncbi:MAG: XrtA/PEP-CTERM system histidine kinase PrsK [Sphingomonadaceae bacterium]
MISSLSSGWLVTSYVVNLAGAVVCAMVLLWLVQKRDPKRPDRFAAILALAVTAGWCIAVVSSGPVSLGAHIAESGRNLAWLFVLYRLFGRDGRDRSLAPIRPLLFALVLLELFQPVLAFIAFADDQIPDIREMTFLMSAVFRMMGAVGALVLVHNLYAGASGSSRTALRWSAAALGGMWIYDFNLYTIAYLGRGAPEELGTLRGAIIAIMAIVYAVGSEARAAELRFRPSRKVAFQSLSLLLIGGYFGLMVALAHSMDMFGADLARLLQVGFVFVTVVMVLLWLPSRKMRGWIRVTLLKHLFQHRYDYRSEWLRFMQTIGRAGEKAPSLPERAVQVLADITDSPSGLLLAPNEDGAFSLAARWQWRDFEVPSPALPEQLLGQLEQDGFIIDLDEVRSGPSKSGNPVPDWLTGHHDAWALVPLVHFHRLMGVVVLSRPAVARSLDWEDFDLLKLAGRQLASYLAEQAGQVALLEANRFDEFNRRIAFVMHDIKNLASQLSLLASNAEKHSENPEFRADMLVTLRKSSEKLNTLIARLNRYGASGPAKREAVNVTKLLERVNDQFRHQHPVTFINTGSNTGSCHVKADETALEQALVHLLQNAVDASDEQTPVFMECRENDGECQIDIVDAGAGMSPQFVQTGLFKPFVSSKNGGFGIGAFEARELVRAMGGQLTVESREGVGTRFTLTLPRHAGQVGEESSLKTEVA